MTLNIKNPEVNRLVQEVVDMTGENKTEAIRLALIERKRRITLHKRVPASEAMLLEFLEDEIWSQVPPEFLGTTITKEEQEAILGYGEDGI